VKEPSLKMKRGVLDIAIVPALANAAFLALLDGALPLEETMVAALGCFTSEGQVLLEPTEKELLGCQSVHAMAYDSHGGILLNESAGSIGVEEWEQMAEALKEKALAAVAATGGDESMSNGVKEKAPWLRQALEENVMKANTWREGG
jgi:exosome complex component RRP46